MNEKNKKGKNRQKSIWQVKGLFVFIVLGVAITAIVSILNAMAPDKNTGSTFDADNWKKASAEVRESVPASSKTLPKEEKQETEKTPTPAPTADKSEGEALKTDGEGIPAFKKPIEKEVQKDFSGDNLVYSKTMKDWRVHEGIDYCAEGDDAVMAAADGKVEEAYEDPYLGMTVVISHSGNIRTLYANLRDINDVAVGQEVKCGDIIGHIGNSATVESLEEPHLHFEIIKDMNCVNPKDYLDK